MMKILKTIGNWVKDNTIQIVLFIAGIILGARAYENFISKFRSSADSNNGNDRREELRTGTNSGFGRINDTVGELQDNQSESTEFSDRSEQLHSESEQLNKRTDSRIAKNRKLLDRIRKSNGTAD